MRRRPGSGKKKRSGAAGVLLVLFFVVLTAVGAAAWLVLAPFGPNQETFVELAPGSSTARIGQELESAGIVRSRFAFDGMRWWKRGTLKAGEYRFDHPVAATEVYARIARGDVFTRTVTIPEGASIFDIAARLEQAGLGVRQGFLDAAMKQVKLVADMDPGARSLEGYLFPDTYHFARKASPAQIAAAMVRRFFQNRLAKKMPLMTAPAVIYGLELEGRWRGAIYQSDLSHDTAYNTYLHTGLPPGPVANPGARSLRAAMEPAKTDYLYFVAAGANPQGRSLFARTLDEHDRNVTGYRHAVKKAGSR